MEVKRIAELFSQLPSEINADALITRALFPRMTQDVPMSIPTTQDIAQDGRRRGFKGKETI